MHPKGKSKFHQKGKSKFHPKGKSKFQKGPNQGTKPNKIKIQNRKSKLVIKFDAEDRKNYLKGFQKRKEERRKKAFDQIQLDLKNELNQIRKDRRKMMKKMTDDSIPDDMEIGSTKKVVTSCGSATVEFTELDFASNDQPILNETEKEDNATANTESDEEIPVYTKDKLEELGILTHKDLKRSVRQSATRAMKASKLMQRREKRHAIAQRKTHRRLNNDKTRKKVLKKNNKQKKSKDYNQY